MTPSGSVDGTSGEGLVLIAEAAETIDAGVDSVFATVADAGIHGDAIPDVERVEFVSSSTTGLGARFRETRRLTGLKALVARLAKMESTLTECTAFAENERVRYTSDAGGTLWHSVYSLEPLDGGRRTRLSVRLETAPHSLMGKVGPPLMRGDLEKGLVSDLKAIKAHCERAGSPLSG